MKKITLLFLFLSTIVATAQEFGSGVGKDSINWHIGIMSAGAKTVMTKGVESKKDADLSKAYLRLSGGSLVFLNIPQDKRQPFRDLVNKQYTEFEPANEKLLINNDQKSAKELVTILLKFEDELRALLTPEQLVNYKKRLNEAQNNADKGILHMFHLSDKVYTIFNNYVK